MLSLRMVTASDEEFASLQTVNSFVSSLSLLGSATVIGWYLLFPDIRKLFTRLILYLCISDFWLASACMLGHFTDSSSIGCLVQGTLLSYFSLTSVLWTTGITYTLRRMLKTGSGFGEIETEVKLHKVCWGYPFILLLLSFFFVQYGNAGFWCWIPNGGFSLSIWRFILFYIPLWMAVMYNIATYATISSQLSSLLRLSVERRSRQRSSSQSQSYINMDSENPPNQTTTIKLHHLRRLLYFPLVLAWSWGFGSLNRLMNLIGLNWYPLDFLAVTFGGLQGFLNAVVYFGTNPTLLHR